MNKARMVLLLGLIGCGPKGDAAKPAEQSPAVDHTATEVTGVVRKSEVGVACWQLIAADSTRYELRADQAPDSLLVDGREVTVSLKLRPDLMSTCQVGKIADVVAIVH